MEEQNLFSNFDMLEQVPTDLMTEITDSPQASNIGQMADHTKINPFDSQPQNNGLNDAPQPTGARPQQMNAGNLITGDMAAGFLDMAIPVVIVLIVEKINGTKLNKKWLQATADEKKTIAPVLQNYLNSINFAVDNPLNALMLTIAFIYGTKTIEAMNYTASQPAAAKTPQPFTNQQGRNVDGSTKKDGRGRPRKKM